MHNKVHAVSSGNRAHVRSTAERLGVDTVRYLGIYSGRSSAAKLLDLQAAAAGGGGGAQTCITERLLRRARCCSGPFSCRSQAPPVVTLSRRAHTPLPGHCLPVLGLLLLLLLRLRLGVRVCHCSPDLLPLPITFPFFFFLYAFVPSSDYHRLCPLSQFARPPHSSPLSKV